VEKNSIAVPIVLIALGFGWLLTAHGVLPGVNWIWILALGIAGVLVLAVGGIDKLTIVLGPFLMACSCLSLLRQTGYLDINTEVPLLVIVGGVLMLIPYIVPVPTPTWYLAAKEAERHDSPAP
jgi:hypothetical protein